MKLLAEEKRTDVIINDWNVQLIDERIKMIIKTGKQFPNGQIVAIYQASEKPLDYFEAMKSINKYCVQVSNGYQIKHVQ